MSIAKEIGHFLKKNINPDLPAHKSQKHLESVVLGSAVLKTLGDVLVKHHGQSGKGVVPAGGSIFKKQGLKILIKNLKFIARKLPHGHSGGALTISNLPGIVKRADSVKLSAKDIFGGDWRRKGKELIEMIARYHKIQKGGSIFGDIGHWFKKAGHDIGHAVKKAVHEVSKFVQGKTKFKPSQLLKYLAGGLGVIAGIATLNPALIGVSAGVIGGISGVIGGVSSVLATSGKGKMPHEAKHFAEMYPEKAKKIMKLAKQKGSGMSKTAKNILKVAGAIGLYGASLFAHWYLKKDPTQDAPKLEFGKDWISEDLSGSLFGEGRKVNTPMGHSPHLSGYGDMTAGSGLTTSMLKFIKANPEEAMEVVKLINKEQKGGRLEGAGIMSKIKTILAIVGLVGVAGAYAFAKYYFKIQGTQTLRENKLFMKALGRITERLKTDALLTLIEIADKLKGSGIHPAGYRKGRGVVPAGGNYGKGNLLPGRTLSKVRRRKVGSKADVYKGLCDRTSGGLRKSDLCINKRGKVVSKKQMENGKLRIANLKRKTA